MTDPDAPPMVATMCTGAWCVSTTSKNGTVTFFLGMPDWNSKGGPLGGLRKLGEFASKDIPRLEPDFGYLFFTLDGQKYEIKPGGQIITIEGKK